MKLKLGRCYGGQLFDKILSAIAGPLLTNDWLLTCIK